MQKKSKNEIYSIDSVTKNYLRVALTTSCKTYEWNTWINDWAETSVSSITEPNQFYASRGCIKVISNNFSNSVYQWTKFANVTSVDLRVTTNYTIERLWRIPRFASIIQIVIDHTRSSLKLPNYKLQNFKLLKRELLKKLF